jgi:hypothetical protein
MFDSGKPAITAAIDPPIVGQDFNRDDISCVVLAARHEGTDLTSISEFPCFVFVCIPALPDGVLSAPIRADDLQVVGWGELYRSAEDAETHRFDG